MKSIQNQYIDLKEGRMSQHNFMRNLRMSMPQYITNVTSFKDAVRILKNKAILNEAMGGNPIEDTIKSYLIKGYSYTEAIKLTAAEEGMDEEVLMSQYPQDTVDIEGYEDEEDDEEFLDMIAKAKQEKEEEEGIKSGFGIQDPMEENQDYFPRDPREMAQAIADEFGDELLSLSGIEREKMAISHAYEKILNSGHPKAKIIARNLAFGYADEDWPMEYISTLNQKLKTPTPEIPMFKGTRDALDNLSIREGKKKKSSKKELHPNQINPSELRMGIKVELEHTDELDVAKKIALDHLAENPYYYTALKLAGVESPSAPKAKVPVAFKKEVSAAVELVDKANAMKPVKGFEKAKASSNKAKKETNKVVKGVEELTHNAQSVRGLQKFAATGGKMKTIKTLKEAQISAALPNEEINNTTKQILQYVDSDIANPILKALSKDIRLQSLRDNRTLLRYMYWEPLPDPAIRALELQFKVEGDTDIDDDTAPREFYILSPKSNAAKNLGSSLEMGTSKASKMDIFKEALEKMVRKVIAETFDGRDNLTNIDENTSKLSPEEKQTLDDLLAVNEGFGDLLNKIKEKAKKGLITLAVLGALLSSSNYTQAQQQQIKQIAGVEMQQQKDGDISKMSNQEAYNYVFNLIKKNPDGALKQLQQFKGTSQEDKNDANMLTTFANSIKSNKPIEDKDYMGKRFKMASNVVKTLTGATQQTAKYKEFY
jgi:hypothetical protein